MPDPRELAAEIAKYEARLASEPRSRVFAQLADAYRKGGRLDEAIRTCRGGLKDHPTYASARMVLGRALIDKGQLQEAEKEFAIVLELSPSNVLAHRLLGDLAAGQGRRDEARQRYEAVLQLTPLDRDVQDALARLTQEEKAPPPAAPLVGVAPAEPAGEHAKQAWALPGEPPTEPAAAPAALGLATETLADLYAQQGFGERAVEIYRELLRQDPARADLREKLEGLQVAAPAPAAAEVPANATGDGVALLERWREAARRRKGALRGGAA
ncbi:MAG TPA: tetratricopeptide repeat protein [Candidatus Methylomirabilis sp.]|jgi:tetratricopeptide (TPR) repeat protein|nr:tetratricopeptide repeat protein [Candidatus Methylomirabilis sp.]